MSMVPVVFCQTSRMVTSCSAKSLMVVAVTVFHEVTLASAFSITPNTERLMVWGLLLLNVPSAVSPVNCIQKPLLRVPGRRVI